MNRVLMSLIVFALYGGELSALGVDLGPFSFHMDIPVETPSPIFRFFNDPICRSIEQHKLLVMFVEKEGEIRKVFLEPYVFGYDEKGKLLLLGYQVDKIVLSDDQAKEENGGGYFGGLLSTFQGSKWINVSFDKVVEIRIIESSSFVVRKDVFEKILKDNEIVDPICMVRP